LAKLQVLSPRANNYATWNLNTNWILRRCAGRNYFLIHSILVWCLFSLYIVWKRHIFNGQGCRFVNANPRLQCTISIWIGAIIVPLKHNYQMHSRVFSPNLFSFVSRFQTVSVVSFSHLLSTAERTQTQFSMFYLLPYFLNVKIVYPHTIEKNTVAINGCLNYSYHVIA